VLGKEYNCAYNSTRIALCLSLCGDLPMRVFENAAQGAMVFCDEQMDLPKLGLQEGWDYVGFRKQSEAIEKFQKLMQEPERVKFISARGKASLAPHTYAARAKELLGCL
jgi:spore maturation protein CgeB